MNDPVTPTQDLPTSRRRLAAEIAHELTCVRCRQGWSCGGIGDADLEAGDRIDGFLVHLERRAAKAVLDAVEEKAAPWAWAGRVADIRDAARAAAVPFGVQS